MAKRDNSTPVLTEFVLIFFPILFLALLHLNAPASGRSAAGNILRVPETYGTIQEAVDSAVDGDLVLVGPGTYYENLVIAGKSIIVASHFHTTDDDGFIEQTIIDGQGGTTITVAESAGQQTRITGFTIQNGSDGISARAALQIDHNRILSNGDGIDYEDGGGLCHDNVFEDNSDDAIDFDGHAAGIVENNVIQFNGDDGIEVRLHPYSGPALTITIRNNVIHDNDEDGIQLIDYADLSDRVLSIERNQITDNGMVGLGLMDNGETREDFRAASIPERIYLYNNTFSGNPYAVTGGDNLIALNNLFVNSNTLALKHLDGGSTGSIAAYNLFWNNGSDHLGSNVDASTSFTGDPLLNGEYQLQPGSPAIDAGTAGFVWLGEAVLDIPAGGYSGAAPDLGWSEVNLTPSIPTSTPESTVTPPATPTATPTQLPCDCPAPSISVRVSRGDDDAEEAGTSGSVNLASSDLELVKDGDGNLQTVGIRFEGIAIPAGATITKAYLEFEVDRRDVEPTSLTFHAEAVDSALPFTTAAGNISGRPVTNASVRWENVPAWNTVDEQHRTPDLSVVVQEVVNHNGWESGNALAFLITGAGKRTAESFNGEATAAPLLVVEFCPPRSQEVVEVRTLLPNEWGIANPAGLSYSLSHNHIALLARRDPDQLREDDSTIVVITPFEDLVGTSTISFLVDAPINVAYDDTASQLLLLNNERAQLGRVALGEGGMPDPATLAVFDIAHLGLYEAAGMSVDPATWHLFILDSGTSEVVSVDVHHEFELISKITLPSLGEADYHGIAIHPGTGNLFVASPAKALLYELTRSGQLISTYDLSALELIDPGALAFGPSADLTDDPDITHLFLAEGNLPPPSGLSGRVLELALAAGQCGAPIGWNLYLPLAVSNYYPSLYEAGNRCAYSTGE